MILCEIIGCRCGRAFLPNLVVNTGPVQVFDCSAIAVDVFHDILAVIDEISRDAA